jgi:anion-transporting  ArsA/GET3 family ATPase
MVTPVNELLDHRLVFVTGKGGVGKSTVAIALGIVGARRGLRTCVVELASQERVTNTFALGGESFRELSLAEGLFTFSVDPEQAMEEYLKLKAGPVGGVLASSKLFHVFAMATPGMRELLTIGKVWELAQLDRRTEGAAPYDLVIVDAPATGHGVAILRTPRTFAEIARVGPIARHGEAIAATLADREFTGVVAVTTAEEMPVNETISLREALVADQLDLDAVIVNAMYPPRFDAEQIEQFESALAGTGSSLARGALKAALSEHARAATQREQRDRLREGIGLDPLELPYVFAEQLGREQLELLADTLARELSRQGADSLG